MAKGIINKHIDSIDGIVLSEKFDNNVERQKGEILICNDPNNPTIYIMDTNGNPKKISGGGSGEGGGEPYDDTAIWDAVNKNSAAINEEVTKLANVDTVIRKEFADADKTIMDIIVDNELVVAEALTDLNDRVIVNADSIKDIQDYTINNKKISESPVLNSNDILISDNYTILTQPAENIVPGDIITIAISKLEVMLANTTLAITAALNDLDSRLGTPSSYDDEGNKHEATGLWKKVEDLEQLINNNV